MSKFLEALKQAPLLADGAMGSLLFQRTGRLSETNHVYEALNADQPDLVSEVHFAYLQAGARCLTSNTFGANRTHLDRLGEEGRAEELNRAGVRLARQAIAAYCEQTRSETPYFVIGSIGPTMEVHESPQEVADIYREQIGALLDEGIDALLLETFTSLPHIMAIQELVGEIPAAPPLVIHMALHQRGPERQWDQDPLLFVKTAADLGASVVGVNCVAPWEAKAFLDAVGELAAVKQGKVLLSAMPNGGDFQRIGHRYLTGVNPEFMGKFARDIARRGVRLIGGCCEVHPPHINEMHNYLHSVHTGEKGSTIPLSLPSERLEPTGAATKKENGAFSRKIIEGEFAVSVELLPSRGTGGLKAKIGFVEDLARSGLADALDLTDGSRGIPLMPPGDFIHVVRTRLGWTRQTGDGLELIPHYTTRDLNVMGLQSRLIGYWANHIHNVLFITGDPPKMSPTYPRSTAVFDLDSVAMIRYAHAFLNAGVDFGGQPLGTHKDPRTRFTIGSGFEPESVDMKGEMEKLRRKIDNGADYIMTQPAFRFEPLDALEECRGKTAILVGVLVLTGLSQAERIAQVPGVVIPDSVFARLGKYTRAEDQARAGGEIAVEQIRWIRKSGWSGLYLMSPSSHRPIIDALGEGLS